MAKRKKRIKPRAGPTPEVLRKSGPHKDRKRKTGRERLRPDELPDAASD